MPRLLQIFIGPELLWLFFYALVTLLIKFSHAPVKSMDGFWVNLGFIVPLLCIPLTFVFYWIPGLEKSWLLLRIWIAGLLGANYVLEKGLNAHTEQGPGIGTVYIMAMAFAIPVLIAGSVFVKIRS